MIARTMWSILYRAPWAAIRRVVLLASVIVLSGCHKTPGDIATVWKNIDAAYIPLLRLFVASAYVMGIWFVLAGVYKLKKYGQMRTMMMSQINITGPLMLLLVGTMLFYFPTLVNLSYETVWGSDSLIGYGVMDENVRSYFQPIVHVVQLVGYISFIRGWVMLSRVGKEGAQPGIFGKAFMHIFGGILAINVMGVVSVLMNTVT